MDNKKLLLDLFNADSAEAVHNIILFYGLDEPTNWKPYGGNTNNAGTFENQQASPENALVEKLTNSIDAILMKECYIHGIDPKSKTDANVPKNMEDAINKFFGVSKGRWENVGTSERNKVAQDIQIIVTDDKKTPNIAIYDNGEGQNPNNFENTFLSIQRGNKNDVPFVQGKYNFGATGAVVFCGDTYRYQMIISRRNSQLDDSDNRIGFTIVRRHILTAQEESEVKLTWYEYLVVDNSIPFIEADFLELGLSGRKFESGSVVKMYSYQLTKPSMATTDLWRELNPLLYESALPILIYEARDYRQHSSTKQLLGNRTRLALDDRDKVVFTKSLQLNLFNCDIPITVYIFDKETKNTEFIVGKSIIYTLNGQTQGSEPKSFVSMDLGFRNLREYMMVCVDCTNVGATARQELFMASRDRLKQGKYYTELREDLITLLKGDTEIKNMDQDYKGRVFKETGQDKELIESLFSQLKSNQDIKKMLSGSHGAFSFYNKKVNKKETEDKKEKNKEKKELRRYPSLFKVKGFDTSNQNYVKAINRGSRGKITLETDVENEFLTRSEDTGNIEITTLDYSNNGGGCDGINLPSHDANKLKVHMSGPYDGEIKLFIEPREEAEIGEVIPLSIKMISSAGEKEVVVYIKIEKEAPPAKEKENKKQEEPELALPKLIPVFKESDDPKIATWAECKMDANDIVKLDIGSEGEIEQIKINMDSNTVKKLMNSKGANIERLRDKYKVSVYAHALMVYSSMYAYYASESNEIDNFIRKEIQEKLNEAVSFSFQYYTNFLMTFENFSD